MPDYKFNFPFAISSTMSIFAYYYLLFVFFNRSLLIYFAYYEILPLKYIK